MRAEPTVERPTELLSEWLEMAEPGRSEQGKNHTNSGDSRRSLEAWLARPWTLAPSVTRVGTSAASTPSRQRTFNRRDPGRRLVERPCRRPNFRSGLKRSLNAPLIPLAHYRVGRESQLAAPYAIGANKPCPQYKRSTVNRRKTRS